MAKQCYFAAVDPEIRSQLIQSCTSHKIRCAGLENPNWTLQDFMNKAKAIELVKIQATNIEEKATTESLNKISTGKNPFRKNRGHQFNKPKSGEKQGKSASTSDGVKKNCLCCGYEFQPDGRASCPAMGKTCFNCGKPNYFS